MPVCRPFALLLSCREDVIFYPSLLVVHYLVFLAIEQLASWSTCQVMLSGCYCFEAQLAGLFCQLWLPSSFVSQARRKGVHCPLQVVVRVAAVQLFLAFFFKLFMPCSCTSSFCFWDSNLGYKRTVSGGGMECSLPCLLLFFLVYRFS